MASAFLPDRALLRVSGVEAEHFLHNLVTCDIAGLQPGLASAGALLTPQGKILFDFLIWREGDGFVIDTGASQRDVLIRRLTMYKLRSKVEIAALDDGEPGATVFWDEEAPAGSVEDLRFRAAGLSVFRIAGRHGDGAREAYDQLRISAGIVESGRDFALEDAFPHDAGLDLIAGVSLRKGCYVGQEVVSRMHHRGTARKRAVIVEADAALPEGVIELRAGGKPIGTLGTVIGAQGLAIVRIDRAGDAIANGLPVTVGEIEVRLTLPAWTGLTFPVTEPGGDA